MKKTLSALALFSFMVAALFAEGFGLVLSGGGAKGAYEVGVWKALEDYGITDDITVISGTSVGALNAALFACSNAGEAEKLFQGGETAVTDAALPEGHHLVQRYLQHRCQRETRQRR